jgi:5-methylcytosine-specific restriction protein A
LTAPGSRYCAEHQAEGKRDGDRPHARARGYSRRWEKLRSAKLAAQPLCEVCLAAGITEAAEVVDHKRPHRGDATLLYDWSNLQSLSKRCHDRKTATQDSGFARRPRG